MLTVAAMAAPAGAAPIFVAQSAGGTGLDVGFGVDLDAAGRTTVTGSFQGQASFGGTSLTAAGEDDIFLARYAADGTLAWVVSAGGTGGDRGFGVAVDDASGATTVTGYFEGTATFGAGEASETILTSTGNTDIFVARYAADGALDWAVRAGGAGPDRGEAVALDAAGAARITGVVEEADVPRVFVAGYNVDGTLAWKSTLAAGPGHGYGVAVDQFGNATVTGSYGPGTGGDTVFVAQYNEVGQIRWLSSAGGSGTDAGAAIAVDGSGNATVTGLYEGTANFGSTTLVSKGIFDAFVARYNTAGQLLWAVSAGGEAYDQGRGVAVDSSGVATVTGLFQGTAMFGATSLTSAGKDDAFVARYAANGAPMSAVANGGTGSDSGLAVAVDAFSGAARVTGFFQGTATFGAGAGAASLSAGSTGTDMFVAPYGRAFGVSAFSAPVDAAPAVNAAKAGRVVPFKFSVVDAGGAPVTNLTTATVRAVRYACAGGFSTDQIEEYTSGQSGLQNLGAGNYQFNFKTSKAWTGCWTLGIDLGDGFPLTANFQFS